MFEEEAKERARAIEENQTLGVYDNEEDYARDRGYNEGEVAGYEDGFNDGADFGYNKANEWNFIKDGKLPAENTECLCILRPKKEKDEPFGNKEFRAVLYYWNGRFCLEERDNAWLQETDSESCYMNGRVHLEDHDDNDWLRETNSDFTDLVIAWKEIVLPKMNDDNYYVAIDMNGKHEICRGCPKRGMFKGTYEECEKFIKGMNELIPHIVPERKADV